MVDSIPSYHLDMITNGLVSTSLPTLGPLLGVPLSWMAINPREKSFRNEQSHHKVGGRVVDSIPSYHLDIITNGLVSTSLPTLGPLLGVPLSWMAINPREKSFRNEQSHHKVGGRVVDSIPSYHLDIITNGLVSTSLPTLGPLLGVPLSWMATNPREKSFRNEQSHHKVGGRVVDSIPSYHLDIITNGLVSTSLPTLGPLLGVPLSWMAINPREKSFRNEQSHHKVGGRVVDSIPSYHLDIITNGLVSTSLPTLGPLLGVPLSWMATNPREKSFRNEQSHHKVGGRVVDSIPSYHLDIITNGLVSTSLPTLGPLLGVPLSWMAINPREKSFRNEQSHHKVGGRVVDSIPSYHLDMTALVAKLHKSGDSSKHHEWSFLLRP